MYTGWGDDWLGWRAEPTAYTNGVDETSCASEGIPEGCAEDVGVEGLQWRGQLHVCGGCFAWKVDLTSTSDIVFGESGQPAISSKVELDRFVFDLKQIEQHEDPKRRTPRGFYHRVLMLPECLPRQNSFQASLHWIACDLRHRTLDRSALDVLCMVCTTLY
jgi:hypothetical protein